jgi:hypothetical protein
MSNINEVYGASFQENAIKDKAMYAAKLYATNIAHKQFNFRNESPDMWVGHNMRPDILTQFVPLVQTVNPNMRLIHIQKTDQEKINMFPYLIKGPVEYFILVDLSPKTKTQLYSLFITPFNMDAF